MIERSYKSLIVFCIAHSVTNLCSEKWQCWIQWGSHRVCSGESKFSNKSINVGALVNCNQVLIPIPDDIDTQEAFDGSFILDFDQFFKLVVYILPHSQCSQFCNCLTGYPQLSKSNTSGRGYKSG